MFSFIGHIFSSMGTGIAAALIAVAGVLSPTPKTNIPPVTPVVENATATTTGITEASSTQATDIEKLKQEVAALKAAPKAPAKVTQTPAVTVPSNYPTTPQPKPSTYTTPSGAVIDSAGNVISGATNPAPAPTVSNVQTGTNYYVQYKVNISLILAIYKSYAVWLQDTSSQLRSASLTLAGYNLGGLYGQERDAAIKLANAEVSVISTMLSNTNQRISSYQTALDLLNSNPTLFIDLTRFNQLQTPEAAQADVNNVEASMNTTLNSVLEALKFH